jgi:hypothetical protein
VLKFCSVGLLFAVMGFEPRNLGSNPKASVLPLNYI